MKIIQAWTHHETGIGTYTIVGLGDDNNIYQWKTSNTKIKEGDSDWKPEFKPYWELID